MYEDFFYKNKNMFDFNGYPDNSKFYIDTNAYEICKIKDETKSIPIVDICELKTYSRCTHS